MDTILKQGYGLEKSSKESKKLADVIFFIPLAAQVSYEGGCNALGLAADLLTGHARPVMIPQAAAKQKS